MKEKHKKKAERLVNIILSKEKEQYYQGPVKLSRLKRSFTERRTAGKELAKLVKKHVLLFCLVAFLGLGGCAEITQSEVKYAEGVVTAKNFTPSKQELEYGPVYDWYEGDFVWQWHPVDHPEIRELVIKCEEQGVIYYIRDNRHLYDWFEIGAEVMVHYREIYKDGQFMERRFETAKNISKTPEG